MSIVVTGATGQLGHLVVEALLERGVAADQVVAAGRAVERLDDLAARGVRVVAVDYDDPATLTGAFAAGDTVLLISGTALDRRVAQHQAVIDAARVAGVERIVYTSAPMADDTPLVLAPAHAATEAAVRDSGLPFTILRHGWYTENYAQVLEQARATGVVLGSAGDGRVASAPRADFAAADAVVLMSPGHEGAVYELAGDVAWDFDELAATLGKVLDRDVTYRRLTGEEHLAALLQAGLDAPTAGFLVALDANTAQGALALATGDLSRLIGRPTTPLADALRALAG